MESDQKLLTLKKQQRNAYRLHVQNEVDKGEAIIESGDAAANEQKLRTSEEKVKGYKTTIAELDEYVQYFSDNNGELEQDIVKSIELNDKITDYLCNVKDAISKLRERSSDVATEGETVNKCPSVRLPKLELAKFGGDPMAWEEFWDSYSSTIHDNKSLSDVDKFKYLKSFLKGEALQIMDGYRLTEANYQEAVGTLRERYGNSDAVVFAHFDALLSLPAASHDFAELQKTYDQCEAYIRSLVALGLEESTFGKVFTPIIISKLPKFVRMDLHRQNGGKPWELSKLCELLAAEIRVRQMSMQSIGNSKEKEETHKVKQDRQHRTPFRQGTTSALVSNSTKATKCAYCDGNHFSDECRKFADVDLRKQKMNDKCFSCLRSGHSARNCQMKKECPYCAKIGHHRSLCYTKFPQRNGGQRQNDKREVVPRNNGGKRDDSSKKFQPANETLSHSKATYLSTGLVDVRDYSAHKVVQGRCFLDSGGSRTFITTEFCHKLEAKTVGSDCLSVAGFQDRKRRNATYKLVKLYLLFADGSNMTIHANVVDEITCPVQILPIEVTKYPFVKDLKLAEPLVQTPELLPTDMLIGNDYYYDIVGTSKISLDGGPKLISTKLGYVLAGRVENSDIEMVGEASMMLLNGIPGATNVTHNIERFWSLEDIGIKGCSDRADDELALQSFNNTVRHVDGRYEVTWPWKCDNSDLPTNYSLAHGRLKTLIKRIGSDKAVMEKYDATISEQEERGIIEKAPVKPNSDRIHYIPHHCVLKPDKATTKLRIVYDASAKSSGMSMSLNEALYRGPVMLSDLCGLLMRFRLHKIGLVSDIEKAFLQVGLQLHDREVTRFLWVKDINKPPVGDNVVTYRFRRVPFGFIAGPFLLGATVLHHLKKSESAVACDIADNLYVDNVVSGCSDENAAENYYKEAKALFNSASMNLREWYSNNANVMKTIPESDRGKESKPKVLGMTWNLEHDSLCCNVGETDCVATSTKRQILQALAKLFDPCGYFAPVTISGKILMQEIWKKQYDWDSKVDDEIRHKWLKFQASVKQIPQVEIPRFVGLANKETKMELHCFCDASSGAYAAVVYLRTTTDGEVDVKLLFAKSRVCPLKQMTIPRLELMAAVVGVRLLKFVENELRCGPLSKRLWSDSKCVLSWLTSNKVSTVFVGNRVREIRSSTDVSIGYVRSELNPADLPSRGCDIDTLSTSTIWWQGPSFLKQAETHWPKDEYTMSDVDEQPAQPDTPMASTVQVTVPTVLPAVLNIENYSSLTRLLRVTAWVQRFVTNLRTDVKKNGPLTAAEVSNAKLFWIKHRQKVHFDWMLQGAKTKRDSQMVRQLGLFIDGKGVIRSRGRVDNAELPTSAKYPILLQSDDPLTCLIVEDCHKKLLHSGVSQTLSEIRYDYWITRGRQQVKKIIGKCRVCRRVQGGPFKLPNMPPLPKFRLAECVPFTYVGLDYLGPLFVRQHDESRQKAWVCLFTCAVVRAVHLETIEDLSAQQLLLCLRRFVAIYGRPTLIVSDNASQFKLADKVIQKLWREVCESDELCGYVSERCIEWKFIPEMSPWMGGFYERLVGSVKVCLKKAQTNRCVTATELQTVLFEIADVINSRPITYVGSAESDAPLSPSHFLPRAGRQAFAAIPDTDDLEHEVNVSRKTNLVHLWRRLQTITQLFWKTWRDSYLLSLRGTSVTKELRNSSNICPSVGAVVLIKDQLPRAQWKLGRIVAQNVGSDGNCRSVKLRVSGGRHLTRPIKLLYPLESSDACLFR